jgi:hypothetical protein
MSEEIKRFLPYVNIETITGEEMYLDYSGDYVLYEDYETLRSERERELAELRVKLAEQQSLNFTLPKLIADMCFCIGTTEHLCVSRFWKDAQDENDMSPSSLGLEELAKQLSTARADERAKVTKEVSETPVVAYIYPASYGSRASLCKNNMPEGWDDEDNTPWFEKELIVRPTFKE